AAVAVAVLLADPRRLMRLDAFTLAPGPADPRVPETRELSAPAPRAPGAFGVRMTGYVNSFPLTLLVALLVTENWLAGINLEATVGFGYFATPATEPGGTPTSPIVKGATNVRYPLDTFLLLALWAWCGWRVLRGDAREDAPAE
ncbi:MAG: hypothetical protein ACKODX_03165, partial [Gemmata sp.]